MPTTQPSLYTTSISRVKVKQGDRGMEHAVIPENKRPSQDVSTPSSPQRPSHQLLRLPRNDITHYAPVCGYARPRGFFREEEERL